MRRGGRGQHGNRQVGTRALVGATAGALPGARVNFFYTLFTCGFDGATAIVAVAPHAGQSGSQIMQDSSSSGGIGLALVEH